MYNYKALAVLSLTCATASALTVPNLLSPELFGSYPMGAGASSKAVSIYERHGDSGVDTSEAHSSEYSRSHSYHPTYEFSPRDGWEAVPITDLSYKYGNVTSTPSNAGTQGRQRSRAKRNVKVDVNTNAIGGTISHAVGETWNSIKGLGKAQGVTITWYVIL